ncbi:acid-sensing ion channel 1B isoform X2 [Hydra vulgaris]|uniref:acid-sensing ion channel 1B isoform X2 n=2 Tax=Hydra vulgaris TaxID=6087 RepID=UPI0006413271|nr:acid-sensing ion channel 1B-like [Hydra vulgaris]
MKRLSDKVVSIIRETNEAAATKSQKEDNQRSTFLDIPLLKTSSSTSLLENNPRLNVYTPDVPHQSSLYLNPLFSYTQDNNSICIRENKRNLLCESNRQLNNPEQLSDTDTDSEVEVLKSFKFSSRRNTYSKLINEKIEYFQRKQSLSLIKNAAKKKLKEIAEERLNAKEIFSRYIEASTLHGYAYVCSDTFYIRRVLWAVLMLLGGIYFVFKLKVGIIEYFQYPFSTLSTEDFPEVLTFPAISICPINNFNISRVQNSILKQLYDADRLPLDKNWIDPGFDIPGNELADILKRSSLQIDKMHFYCDWISRNTTHPYIGPNPCGIENFTEYFNFKDQLCFTLNSGKKGFNLLSVDHEGLTYGYELGLDVHTNEIISSYPYNGIKLIIHNQQESPVMSDGFVISPGDRTFIKMATVEKKSLQPPYSTECGSVELKYHSVYNRRACLLELLTEYLGLKCGCRSLYMPDNGMQYCSLKETFTCMFPAQESFNEYEMGKRCPVECNSITFKHELTYSRYQPQSVSVPLMETLSTKNITRPVLKLMKEKNMGYNEIINYIRENIIFVIFFFGDMKKEVHEQEATFDFYQFLGDMGGEIGLMLGASLLTFVEFMDLLIFFVYHQLLRIQS